MLTPASASGSSTDASTPVMENGNGPCSWKQRQSFSDFTLLGAYLLSQTTESSSGVRVMENTSPRVAHCGIEESAASRHTENLCGSNVSLSGCVVGCRSIQ